MFFWIPKWYLTLFGVLLKAAQSKDLKRKEPPKTLRETDALTSILTKMIHVHKCYNKSKIHVSV